MVFNKWLIRQNKDIYVKNAKIKGYVSRAAYKLIEIEKKFKIIKKSSNILELGSAPGSWSQVILEINENIKIDAYDVLDMKFSNSNIFFHKKNFLEVDFSKINKKYDLILSDLAPNTIGHKSTDHLRIISMIEKVIDISKSASITYGNLIIKILKGSEEKNIINQLKYSYKKVNYYKPKSSRSESSETYIVAERFLN